VASIKEIRTAIQTVVGDALNELTVYRTVPDVENLPALVVMPAETNFVAAMGRGVDTHTFSLYLLVSNREAELAQDELDDYVTGSGAKSIRQVVWLNRTLGLANTDAHISGMSGYGGSFETALIEHVGAVLNLIVHSPGTA